MSLTAIIIIGIVVAAGGGTGAYFIIKNSTKKPVKSNSKAVTLKVIVGKITNKT